MSVFTLFSSFLLDEPYDDVSMTLHIPDDYSTDDFEYLSLYCVKFTENFGSVHFPDGSRVPAALPDGSSVS